MERGGAAEGAWDSSDDEADDELQLCSTERALPAGYTVVDEPPPAELLGAERSEQSEDLRGRQLLFNWRGVGWVSGHIIRSNKDRRVKIKVAGVFELVNYIAFYSDETEAKHCLSIDTYGDQGLAEDGRWVLLQSTPQE